MYFTLKYLKPIQLVNRITRKLPKVKPTKFLTETNNASLTWNSFAAIPSCYQGNGKFKFLNMVDTVGDWNDREKSKLWLYNLHYFDDLNQLDWPDRSQIHNNLINTWIEKNPLMEGNGWEPYPISLRSVNWIKWFLSGNHPKKKWLRSLSLQVQALEQQLEYHLLGNHLFTNAKALVFAGCFFKGNMARAWLHRGLDILDEEITEQILVDGGNFELSPMYHNIILNDLLDLYQLTLVYPNVIDKRIALHWSKVIEKMFDWAESMQHPDGDISFFNDSAIGIAPKLDMLKRYAVELNLKTSSIDGANSDSKVCHLTHSGYVVVTDQANKLIIDAAKVGPDYIPGHGHADTLSFELSVDNVRVFVNSGTSVYGIDQERLRQRKTEAHNTVVVDDMDSSEVWSGFRVARRAYPYNLDITEDEELITIECSHNGYMHLPGKVTHTRQWQLAKGKLIIRDQVFGKYNKAEAHYHLHPNVQVEFPNGLAQVILYLSSGAKYIVRADCADIKVLNTTWHPRFGESIPSKKLVLKAHEAEINFTLTRA